jgi:hypothetical protein
VTAILCKTVNVDVMGAFEAGLLEGRSMQYSNVNIILLWIFSSSASRLLRLRLLDE